MKSCLFIFFIVFLGLNDFFAQTIGSIKNPIDGLTYKTVDITGKVWLAENLKTTKFNNGEVILQAKNVSEWVNAAKSKTPAWCYYNFDAKNGEVYGKMYNGFAVNDLRGIAPQGWHIATAQEWGVLNSITGGNTSMIVAAPTYDIKYSYIDVGGYYEENWVVCSNCKVASAEYKKICPDCKGMGGKNVKGKYIPKTKQKVEDKVRKGGWNGSDNYKFGVLPGGCIMYDGSGGGIGTLDKFGYMNGSTSFWTANAQSQVSFNEYNVRLSYSERAVKISDFGNGFYVRCVKGTDEEVKAELLKQQLQLVENKKKECQTKNLVYDEKTGECVAPVQQVDPDVLKLKEEMEIYLTILNSFTDPTGWSQIYTLSPTKYTPNNLNIDLLSGVTRQVVELINDKGSSSDFGLFIKILSSIKSAYNVDKYRDFFQNKVDPGGKNVFGEIDGFINSINTAANEKRNAYGYDPLTKPTEKQIREFIFSGQLRSVYKVGKVNLMMDVYKYNKGVSLKDEGDAEITSQIQSYFDAVKNDLNFNTCKDILSVYKSTYDKNVYTDELFIGVRKQIQKCYCEKHYEDLEKVGMNNMFDSEMKKDRKELKIFLNSLGSSIMGDYAIPLNEKVCRGIKIPK